MEIVKYDKKEQSLYIKYNTHVVWKYNGVTQEDFNKINADKSSKTLKNILRQLLTVGTYKG